MSTALSTCPVESVTGYRPVFPLQFAFRVADEAAAASVAVNVSAFALLTGFHKISPTPLAAAGMYAPGIDTLFQDKVAGFQYCNPWSLVNAMQPEAPGPLGMAATSAARVP